MRSLFGEATKVGGTHSNNLAVAHHGSVGDGAT